MNFDRAIKTAINTAGKRGLKRKEEALKNIRAAADVGPDDDPGPFFTRPREYPKVSESGPWVDHHGRETDFDGADET